TFRVARTGKAIRPATPSKLAPVAVEPNPVPPTVESRSEATSGTIVRVAKVAGLPMETTHQLVAKASDRGLLDDDAARELVAKGALAEADVGKLAVAAGAPPETLPREVAPRDAAPRVTEIAALEGAATTGDLNEATALLLDETSAAPTSAPQVG